jgi:hypothetical protein
MISANKKSVLNFTKHIMRARLKMALARGAAPEQKAEELRLPEFLIKRAFPQFRIPQIQFNVQPKVQEKVPVQEPVEIFELGKITKFAMDKMISLIECQGPDVPLRIKKENHLFSTDIKLSESEIKEIVDLFSKEARTPVSPVFTASARKFSMTAILSDYGSRFIIKRMN